MASEPPTVRTGVTILAVVAAIWLLRTADAVFVPIALAAASAAVVRPVHRWLVGAMPRRLRLVAHLLAAAIPVAAVAVLGGVVALALAQVAGSDQIQLSALEDQVRQARSWAEARGIPLPSGGGDTVTQVGRAVAAGVLEVAGGALIALFLLLLLLDEAGTFERVIDRVPGEQTAARLHAAAEDWARSVRQFLVVRTLAGVAAGALGLGWMLIHGVELAWVWAVQTFILNYVPKLGSLAGGVPPVLITLVQHGPGRAAVLAGGLLLIEQLVGNWLDPKLQGGRLDVSSFFVLVAVVFFGWMWGVAGAFLAIPLLTLIVTVLDRFELAPSLVALLRGRTPDDAPGGR